MPAARLVPLALALILAGCDDRVAPAVPAPAAPAAVTVTLSIVGTNDLHGGVLQREDRGGLALLGGYVANLRAARDRDGGAVLLVDAGDLFQGTLESNLNEGAVVVAAYDALGYAAVAIGNHDFDFGPAGEAATPASPADDPRGALKARAASASFPFLAANVIDEATGKPVAWRNVLPSTLVTAAGVQVGIIGVTTARTLETTIAANTSGLRIGPLAASIEAEATRLRASGAAVIVVAAHAGGTCADFSNPLDLSSCAPDEEIVNVIHALPRGLVDVVVAGHRHLGIGHQIDGVAVTEAYAGGRSFGRVDLVVDRAARRVTGRRSFAPRDLCSRVDPGTTRCDPEGASVSRVPAEYEGAAVTADAAVARVLAPGVEAARRVKTRPLGITLSTPLRRTAGLDSPLGNLFTDAFLAAVPGAGLVVNNTDGGLRADMPAGPVTYGTVFEVMPFDNRVVAFHLSGAEIRKMVTTWMGARVPVTPGIAGLRIRVSCQGPALHVALIRPDGQPVEDRERVLVVTTDFLATNGDNIFASVVPPDGFTVEQDVGTVRDVVIGALKKYGSTLGEAQLLDGPNPRWALPGPRPVMCSA